MKKVILAFSGGLDTTFCTLHLIEKGFQVITAIVDSGGFTKKQLKKAEERAFSLGASKHYCVDVKEKIYDSVIDYAIKFNSLYEDDYPLMCSDRYIIASEIAQIAKKEKANFVAHGSTANGNDQVRFDSAFLCVAPNLTILCPIKYLNISREEEIAYLDERGVPFESSNRKYSINENVFGITYSGSEIDEGTEPEESLFKLTKIDNKISKTQSDYFTIDFDRGSPVALDGVKKHGLTILSSLNMLVGKYGFGRGLYVGDCIIGIKGRIAFEAPGLLTLIKAHKKLEQLCMTKRQLKFSKYASDVWTDLVYGGQYFEPLTRDLETFCDSVQGQVCGRVKLKISVLGLSVVEVITDRSLLKNSVAMYAQRGSWDAKQADGFIKLYTLQQKIASQRKKS